VSSRTSWAEVFKNVRRNMRMNIFIF
jgi:hypothetical protein